MVGEILFKSIILFVVLILFSSIALAVAPVILSDQGTDVRSLPSGTLLSVGNLTINIYDSSTGGNGGAGGDGCVIIKWW